ncbi:MAG TPA: tRNA pseudouridine(38-40) synthase TruA, partial [Vicinamibacterales bacterium]|nr:tRNA pseudouridine(38-40) synthase TruA [Vicinamibacterales bacterium]
MPRYRLTIEYAGTRYSGWQIQKNARTIQGEIDAAVRSVTSRRDFELYGSGRTDAGVHAAMQVVHFDTDAVRSERSWVLGANSNLPETVSALWAQAVPASFHARYSARARSYRYFILNRSTRAALARHNVCWIKESLDHERMQMAAQALLGEHDFTSFRAAECQSR